MAYETFTLHGGPERSIGGALHVGSVRITASAVVREVGGGVVFSGSHEVTIGTDGLWSIDLPCTDDPGLLPAGHSYSVDFRFQTATRQTIRGITAPPGTGTLDAGTVATTTAPAAVDAPAATAADLAALTTQVDALGTTIAYDTDGTPYLL
jgi:hypothetical protein